MVHSENDSSRLLLEDHPAAWRWSLVLWGMAGFLFIAMALPTLRELVQTVDDEVWRLAGSLSNDVAVALAKAFDLIGSSWVTVPVVIVVAAALAVQRRWGALASWLVAMAVSQLMIGPVKNLYERPRPPLPLVETTSWAFPSGHAVAGAAIAVALVIVWTRPGPLRRNLLVLAALFSFLMALSRVYLRAHWLSDVAAGVALGAAAAIGAAAAVQWWRVRRADAERT